MENERMYSVQEALEVLKEHGIVNNLEVLRRWLREGKLEGIAPISRKEGWRVTQSALDVFVAVHSINTTDVVALKKELHDLRNTTDKVVKREEAFKAHYERRIADLKAEHAKALLDQQKAHKAEMDAFKADLTEELRESMQHEADLLLESEREMMQRCIDALREERDQLQNELEGVRRTLAAQNNGAIIDDIVEAEWMKYYAMGFVNDMVLIRKTHVKDALAHRQLSGSYAKELFETIWHKLEMNNYGRGKDIRIAVLDEHFKFDGQRIKLSDDFTTMSERVIYPILEYVRKSKSNK